MPNLLQAVVGRRALWLAAGAAFFALRQAPSLARTVTDVEGELRLIGQPGDETADRTSRLVVESYQMAYQSNFGEGVRLMLLDANAKNMIAWYDGFSDPANPKPVAWVGAHSGTHLSGVVHRHWSVETAMANGELHTRFAIDYGRDLATVLFNKANVVFSASTGGKVRIGVAPNMQTTHPRDVVFGTGAMGADTERRWAVRCDTTPETGRNKGSDFGIVRYTDSGAYVDTPLSIDRETGDVHVKSVVEAAGVVLRSGNGSRWRLTVDNDGNLHTEKV